ncbi:MAG: hypothetical protein NTW94_04725 [Legionellales bacterium]|nr:hypothetical protein [Legionellales bacterium]
MSSVIATNNISLCGITATCGNHTLGDDRCDELIRRLKAPGGPDVVILTCQEVELPAQVKQLERSLSASSEIKLTTSSLMLTFGRHVLTGHTSTGYATLVLYRDDNIKNVSFVKDDVLEIRGSIIPGKRWNHGGHSNTLLITCCQEDRPDATPTVYRVSTLSGQLSPSSAKDSDKDLNNIKQRITKRVRTWDDLVRLIPDLQMFGLDAQNRFHASPNGEVLILKNNTRTTLSAGPEEGIDHTMLRPTSPFMRIRHHIASELIQAAPKLAEEIDAMDETDDNKAILLSLHQHYLSPNGVLIIQETSRMDIRPKIAGHTLQQFLGDELARCAKTIEKSFEPRKFTTFKKKYVAPMAHFEKAFRDFCTLQSPEHTESLNRALHELDQATEDPKKKATLQTFQSCLNTQSISTPSLPKHTGAILGIAEARALDVLYRKALPKPGEDAPKSKPISGNASR